MTGKKKFKPWSKFTFKQRRKSLVYDEKLTYMPVSKFGMFGKHYLKLAAKTDCNIILTGKVCPLKCFFLAPTGSDC